MAELNIPYSVYTLFTSTVLLTVFLFYKASNQSKITLLIISLWLLLQGLVSASGFYLITDTLPPRFLLLIGPAFITVLFLAFSNTGKNYIQNLDLKVLTLFHVVRIPVEFCLLLLFKYGTIPQLMTFEGINFDIVSGLSAPLIYYYGFIKKTLSQKLVLIWNIACLLLLINIVFHGVLSVPTPFQKYGFDQPNRALINFPFIFLPGLIVPLVLFAHLVSIKRILKN